MPINANGPRPHTMLAGVSGSIKVQLKGGTVISGTVDTSALTLGVVKVTDATPTTWVIALENIVAIGQ